MKHHAITFRNFLCGGLIYAALGAFQIASAFVTPSPPPGFSNTPEGWVYRGEWVNGSARSAADLTVAGRRVQIPVYFRVAANAPTYAARFMFKHPLLLTAAATALLVSEGLQWQNNQWQLNQPSHYPVSDGFHWRIDSFSAPTPLAVCMMWARTMWSNPSCILTTDFGDLQRWHVMDNSRGVANVFTTRSNNPNCPVGWFVTAAGCVQNPPPVQLPQTEEQFVERVAPQIVPERIPDYIPQTIPLPVEPPVINPEPQPIPAPVPYVPPRPRPLIVPLSDPVPIPNTDPQQWRQPLVQINPSPTAANPWRVSLNPKERITSSPHGITDPVSDLDPATPAQPSAESDFCIRNPEVLACARVPEFDIPNDEIQTLTEVISYEPEQFLGGGSCPRPVTVNLGGHTITAFDTPLYCQFISSYFRPVLLAIAAFTSMTIVAGGFRSV